MGKAFPPSGVCAVAIELAWPAAARAKLMTSKPTATWPLRWSLGPGD